MRYRKETSAHVAVAFVLMLKASAIAAAGERVKQAPPDVNSPPPSALELVTQPWTGDFDGMVKRRQVRILTPYSRTHYFVDKGIQRGIVYDVGVKLEEEINNKLRTRPATRVHVVFVPTPRTALYQSLIAGRGDVIATNITITSERARFVDFTVPGRVHVNEVLVTGPGAAVVETLDDLAGKEIAVREQSVEFASLVALNTTFEQRGKPPVVIRALSATLEDEDLLEMVNAGLLKATVVDDFVGEFWKRALPDLDLHSDVVLRDDVAVAWAFRKGSSQLSAMLNPFIERFKPGTLFGNSTFEKYLRTAKFVRRATTGPDFARFLELVEIFRKYSDRYALDYLLMMAQGYQESRFDQRAVSRAGGVGIMQLMPATGRSMAVGDIRQVESNVHAGVKYLRTMIDRDFDDRALEPLTRALFALAAYNCGPTRVRQLRREAERRGLDANRWFGNVERVAGERVGRETVEYVSNIYKYYVGYRLALELQHSSQPPGVAR